MAEWNDDAFLLDDDSGMFGGSERYEERKRQWERAKEIASGLVMGTFERDDKVWEYVNKIKETEK